MHIPDGFLDPKVSAGLMGAAAFVLGYCLAKVRSALTGVVRNPALAAVGQGITLLSTGGRRVLTSLGERHIYKMGMVGSLIFALQLFDFPVGFGVKGHLLGGTLAAIVLGPWAGTLTMSVVLFVQAVLMGDGGVLVLGANIMTMAIVGSLLSYFIFFFLKKQLPIWLAVMITAWLSVFLAALTYSLIAGWRGAHEMLYAHVIVGLAEALLTLVIVKLFKNQIAEF